MIHDLIAADCPISAEKIKTQHLPTAGGIPSDSVLSEVHRNNISSFVFLQYLINSYSVMKDFPVEVHLTPSDTVLSEVQCTWHTKTIFPFFVLLQHLITPEQK